MSQTGFLRTRPFEYRGQPGTSPIRALPWVSATLLLLLSGCSTLDPYSGPATPAPVATEPVAIEPVPVAATANTPPPTPAVEPSAPAATPMPAAPPPEPAQILVLRSSDADNYLRVSEALARRVDERFELHPLNLTADDADLAAIAASPWDAAVAIGIDAADYAATRLDVPVVFSQIFDFAPLLEQHAHLIGVEALPPFELQLASWKAIAPNAKSIGIIVGSGASELVAEAERAAAALSIELHVAEALTDRDAIYQFKRFAQTVDGLWLQPDSTILSPTAIHEILDYALSHQVQTIVFSASLLDWGALLSVGSDNEDVAATVAAALDQLAFGDGDGDGDGDSLHRVLPLSKVDARINEEVAGKLGVRASPDPQRARRLLTARDDDT